jgi:hypothetical protein
MVRHKFDLCLYEKQYVNSKINRHEQQQKLFPKLQAKYIPVRA